MGRAGESAAPSSKNSGRVIQRQIEIIALGTNAVATANMLKAGANRGASGQNAIVQTSRHADMIVGPISIVMANAMLGELTPSMAEAISFEQSQENINTPISGECCRGGCLFQPTSQVDRNHACGKSSGIGAR